MRLSYSDIQAQFLRNINQSGNTTDTNLISNFNYYLGTRYQTMLAKLRNFKTATSTTFTVGMLATLSTTGTSQAITSITSVSTTATVTTSAAHGYSNGNTVIISGVSQSGYNGSYTITVLTTTTFTYTLTAAISTAATSSQYYPYPLGYISIVGMFITVGSVNYPLKIISNLFAWEQLNAIQIQASALPQFYFPTRDNFGIWPTPQANYVGTLMYTYRDRDLSVADYTTGTVTMTFNSNSVVGSGTTFTPAMVGRWITVTDTTVPGQGYWVRVAGYTSATIISLEQAWPYATAAGTTYRIGETPELPEEGHQLLVAGVTADFYTFTQKDLTSAAPYENFFWTGDVTNTSRQEGSGAVGGGLIGMVDAYNDRDDARIIDRKPRLNPLNTKVWATSLS